MSSCLLYCVTSCSENVFSHCWGAKPDKKPYEWGAMPATRYDVYCRFYCCVFCNQPIQSWGGREGSTTRQGWVCRVGQHFLTDLQGFSGCIGYNIFNCSIPLSQKRDLHIGCDALISTDCFMQLKTPDVSNPRHKKRNIIHLCSALFNLYLFCLFYLVEKMVGVFGRNF